MTTNLETSSSLFEDQLVSLSTRLILTLPKRGIGRRLKESNKPRLVAQYFLVDADPNKVALLTGVSSRTVRVLYSRFQTILDKEVKEFIATYPTQISEYNQELSQVSYSDLRKSKNKLVHSVCGEVNDN